MSTAHKYWIWRGGELFLTASTWEWAQLKVAAFAGTTSEKLIIELAPWAYVEQMKERT